MTEQTAVEWIGFEMNKLFTEIPTDTWIEISELFKQAKQMEKDQIKNAYWNGTTDMEKQDALLMAEDFYKDYYKK